LRETSAWKHRVVKIGLEELRGDMRLDIGGGCDLEFGDYPVVTGVEPFLMLLAREKRQRVIERVQGLLLVFGTWYLPIARYWAVGASWE
jgi:hypothetical protein